MKKQRSQDTYANRTDEAAIRNIHKKMIDAWNKGSAVDFAAPFTEDADFVAFEGTHLKGQKEIVSFHKRIFDTLVKGSRLHGEVKFVRFLGPELALMHSVVMVTLPGQREASPGRDSMQIYVVTKQDEEWRAEGLLNARKLTIERQYFLDDIDSLPAEDQLKVTDLVASLKQRLQPLRGQVSE